MAQKEKFGKFILLEEVESTPLGTEHRAAKLGPGGLDKIVSLIRFAPTFSANTEVARRLMDQAKTAAQLQSPNIQKILGIGKVEGSYYISYEYMEGKNLHAIFNRCRQEGFPMSVDHALLIASKICSSLEHAHSRRVEGVGRYVHGFLTPRNIIVSYEGELKVRGFGYWPAGIWDAGFVVEDEAVYLAPEQISGQPSETRSDIFSVGTILFEALAGRPLFEPGARTRDTSALIAAARLHCAPGDDEPLPKPIAEILNRALAAEPDGRQLEVQELRKAIDTLLFSGDFTPTTFNLAFFMHSLFRDDIERESKALKQEREASYFDFLAEAPGTPVPPLGISPTPEQPVAPPLEPPPAASPIPHRIVTPAPPVSPPAEHTPPAAFIPPPRMATPPPLVSATPIPHAATPHPPISTPAHHPSPPVADSALTAPMFAHAERPHRSRMGLLAIVAVVLVAAGVGGFFVFKQISTTRTPTTTLSTQYLAALKREKQLKEELQKLQEEAEVRRKEAEEEAERLAREQAEREKRIATERELEAARQKAREEQERKQREERERLEQLAREEEARIAEEKRKMEEERKRREEEERRRAAASTPTPPPTPSPPPPPEIYGSGSDGVTPPVSKCGTPTYPAVAKIMGVSGTVRIMFVVDKTGKATDIRFLSGPDIFKQPAIEHVRNCRFKPATKDKVNVKYRLLWGLRYSPH